MTAASPEPSGPPGLPGPAGPVGRPGQPRTLPSAVYPNWEAIYSDNVGRIYRLMYSKVGNRHDAEDLTSQVFLTALGPLRTTASVGEVRSYLLATARTVLATHWRSTLGHQVTVIDVDAVDLEDFTGPGSDERSGPTAEQIGTILSGLPERHRAILTLRFLRGYSIKAAAAELGVTVSNAKVLQHRALRRAAGLDKEGDAS
ncbi:sigma-70 family RNA polymerase sigma factor [Catenulispora subtropica]|uniref:Sigma-70 family RNA polymerase sigma factor n=1 Tax=Catenulispora subtropica TaxID=450798 RepID=A0ABN2T1R4_9ACTN